MTIARGYGQVFGAAPIHRPREALRERRIPFRRGSIGPWHLQNRERQGPQTAQAKGRRSVYRRNGARVDQQRAATVEVSLLINGSFAGPLPRRGPCRQKPRRTAVGDGHGCRRRCKSSWVSYPDCPLPVSCKRRWQVSQGRAVKHDVICLFSAPMTGREGITLFGHSTVDQDHM